MATRRKPDYHQSTLWKLYDSAAEFLDHKVGWARLPVPLGLVVLVGLRDVLRKRNLYDTSDEPAVNLPPVAPATPEVRTSRTTDGTYNDLDEPRMGMAGSRFGRNVPIDRTYQDPTSDFMQPSPREVSRALLTRDELIPATAANALVATWLQFMIKDWFSHGTSPKDDPWDIPLTDDDDWPAKPMQIMRSLPDPTAPPGEHRRPTHANANTHWWDLSQIYGTSAEAQQFARTGTDGKLRVDPDGLPPVPDDPAADPRKVPGFWVGLVMMQTLFTLEHNAICDRLRAEYQDWSDEEIFQRARLINAALVAKIHTVEWTPAVIGHPTTKIAMRANWFGLAGERVHKLLGRISSSEVISGIPGSPTEQYGVPFSLTEEFVAVYRMHPLVPDDYSLRSATNDQEVTSATLRDLAGPNALDVARKVGVADLLYSFGTQHPGLVTLHNFPKFLQEFYRPDGNLQDLAATDILRSRELGVPRYNEFRRLLHLTPARDFDQLTDNPEWAREIERVYGGDIEKVDLTVGAFAEPRPAGFAFSDTAFRIFILMASRRLNSDRFFAQDYTAAVYTQEGMDWINDNSMATVLVRHYPQLRPAIGALPNAFQPWARSVPGSARPATAGAAQAGTKIDLSDPATLVGVRMARLGTIFGTASAGPIPDGRSRGTVLLGTGGWPARLAAQVSYALLWRGKVVNARKGRLKNLISAFSVPAIAAEVYEQASWYDQKPCIVLDYSKTSLVARMVRDEIREIAPGVYLGLVFWGRHHVLDFTLDFTRPD
jgi:Animal haem peroxidase